MDDPRIDVVAVALAKIRCDRSEDPAREAAELRQEAGEFIAMLDAARGSRTENERVSEFVKICAEGLEAIGLSTDVESTNMALAEIFGRACARVTAPSRDEVDDLRSLTSGE